MNRVGLLGKNQFATALRDIRTASRELKNRQRFSGKSGLLGYLTDSGSTWDLTGTLSSTDSFAEFEIVWTGDGSQQYPVAQVYCDIFFFGTDEANRPDDIAFTVENSGDFAAVIEYNLYDPDYSDNLLSYRWTITANFFTTTSIPYYLKAFVVGSSLGTLTVTRTI